MQHQQPHQGQQSANQGQQTGQPSRPAQSGQSSRQGNQGYFLIDEYPVAPGVVEEDIWYIPGPQTGQGPKNYQHSDEHIQEEVSHRLTQHGQLNASDIEVNVKNGVVTLTGSVDSRQAKRMAEKTTDTVPGVKDVQNQLTINSGGQQGQTQPQQQQTAQR